MSNRYGVTCALCKGYIPARGGVLGPNGSWSHLVSCPPLSSVEPVGSLIEVCYRLAKAEAPRGASPHQLLIAADLIADGLSPQAAWSRVLAR